MNDPEALADLGEVRIPAGCRLDLHAGFGYRLCVEPYEEVAAKRRDADPRTLIEFQVLAGIGQEKAEIVRFSIEAQLIAGVLEITDDLEERWKEFEREQEEEAARPRSGDLDPRLPRRGI